MKATLHYLPGATIQVEPTMEALGDQPWRCRVYPDQPAKDRGYTPIPRKPETYPYFQALIVEAGSREEALRAAAREFNSLYPNGEPILFIEAFTNGGGFRCHFSHAGVDYSSELYEKPNIGAEFSIVGRVDGREVSVYVGTYILGVEITMGGLAAYVRQYLADMKGEEDEI